MPTKRPADTPQRARKRARVPKFQEGNEEDEDMVRRVEEDDDEDDVQADYLEEGGHYVEDIYIPPKLTLTERPTRGERLIIQKIECENFKSYGGLKVMGPFHKSFSAIVGPNGNGKSNIIDAMLFVFGYRAKKIRCKKVSVLIHKSELLAQVNSCAVTVHFIKIIDEGDDDEGDLKIVPNSNITVCRRAYTNNSSGYWLNEKRVQFTEVASFLKQNGIDIVHNRFLILQGEVEQIAQMPPKATNTHETGFLEFIDEIIGTKRYEKPLQLLKAKQELYDVQRDDKSQRVTLAQKHKESMVEPMKKATAFLRDRNSKIRTHHTLNQVKSYRCRKAVEEKAEELKKLQEKQQTILQRLNEIKEYNDEKKHEYSQAEKAYQTAEMKFKKNKKALDDADAKYVELNREIKTSNDERKKKMQEIEKSKTELEKLHGLPESHAAEIEKLEKRKTDLEKDIAEEEKARKNDLEKLNQQVEQHVTEKKKADAELRKLKTVVDNKKALRDTLKKELERNQANETGEKEKLEKLKQEFAELQQVVKRKSGEGLNIQPDEIPRKEEKARSLRDEAAKLQEIEQIKRVEFQKLRSKLADTQQSMDGGMITDRIDKALFAAKDRGSFPGLYGRVKDLATIDEKFNIAATVSSGMLDYWVTDNDQTAAECIQFLKDQKLPFQTFVCVNKTSNMIERARQRFNTPKNSLRIFDLLKIVKPELAPVFYKAFMNTLVAENIEIATNVAYGGSVRYRVATCQGDIVETTGSLLGGGQRITHGKFNSGMAKRLGGGGISKQALNELKANCESAEKDMTEVIEERKRLEAQAIQLEREVHEIKAKMTNYHSDLEASKKMIPYKAALVKEQEKKVKDTTLPPHVLQEKMRKIEEAEAELAEATEPFEEAQESVKHAAENVRSLQEDKKKEILKKLNKCLEQKKRVTQELDKLNVELRNCEKNKVKLDTKIKKLTSDKEALQDRMIAMNDKKKSLEEIATNLKEREEELSQDKEEKEQIYNELKTKANKYDQEEKSLNKERVTNDNNLQTCNGDVQAFQNEERAYSASLQEFKLSEIPEVEVEPLQIFTADQLEELNQRELEGKLRKYTEKLKREEPNLNIIEDYNAACQTLLKRIGELDDVNSKRENINTAYLTLEAQRMREFMDGYAMISAKVKELFRMISMGGDAELDLLDSTDPFSCGIDFSVRPRGKTWKKIINLSGGEKTLSSLALVFSLHHFKPSPFYVMDEIDAALDFQNVSIIANYIKDRTKFTQFIIISLRSNMFELADSLLGVYKVDNMSYSIRMGVTGILNKLKEVHIKHNKMYVMGINDETVSSRKTAITVSTQATQPALSQQTVVVPPGPPSRPPELDISAIRDSDVSNVSNGASKAHPTAEQNEPVDVIMRVIEENHDTCASEDLFNDSYETDERLPLAASTPFTRPRKSSQRTSPEDHEQREKSDSEKSDVSEIFASLSSENNSQFEECNE